MDDIEIYPNGCPGDLPKLQFDIVVNEPNPDAQDIADQKNSTVVARYEGEPAGAPLYGFMFYEVWMTVGQPLLVRTTVRGAVVGGPLVLVEDTEEVVVERRPGPSAAAGGAWPLRRGPWGQGQAPDPVLRPGDSEVARLLADEPEPRPGVMAPAASACPHCLDVIDRTQLRVLTVGSAGAALSWQQADSA